MLLKFQEGVTTLSKMSRGRQLCLSLLPVRLSYDWLWAMWQLLFLCQTIQTENGGNCIFNKLGIVSLRNSRWHTYVLLAEHSAELQLKLFVFFTMNAHRSSKELFG